MKKTLLFKWLFGVMVLSAVVSPSLSTTASATEAVVTSAQRNVDVTVIVKDETGLPVIGATVFVVENSAKAAVTAPDGSATIKAAPANGTLSVSMMGYKDVTVAISDRSSVNVVLEEEALAVDEVIVVGYGVQRKSNLTGSVATVSEKAIESRPIQSVSQALQGQIPGVVAIQSSGQPGSQTASITIRGKNTINSAGPYVIVDGVPGDMNNIDPNDVASISVLKDAASSAIYGVQAANGVILITTKKGRAGATSVSYSGNFALTTPTRIPNYLGSYDYAVLYNESQKNENPSITESGLRFSAEDLELYKNGTSPYTHPNTDWYAETFRKVSSETSHHISISGGSEKTVYSGSYGFTYQNGNTTQNSYQRNNMRFNIENQATKWLKLGANLSGYIADTNQSYEGPTSLMGYANRLAPIYPVYTDETESDYYYAGMANPVAVNELSGTAGSKNLEYNANMYAQVNFLENLSLKGVYSNRGNINNSKAFRNEYTYGTSSPTTRYGYDNTYRYDRETIQALLNYDESWGKHNFAALAGYEQYLYQYRYVTASRENGGNNNLDESLNTLDPSYQFAGSGGNELARQSYFGRLQYNYDNKYYVEGNLRADASSRFSKENRWGYFPSISAAWRISEEDFMKSSSAISNLKLRAGYGQTGNEEIDSYYPSQSTYSYGTYNFGGSVYSTTAESRYVNDALTWATVTNYEAAVEAGFLRNKLSVELSVYKKVTNDMLLTLSVPSVLGASAPEQNAGSVQNVGFDVNVGYRQTFGEVNFSANANLGFVKNKITDLQGTEGANPDNSLYWYLEGESIGSLYGLKAIGLFANDDEVNSSPLYTGTEQPGDIKYADLNGDGKITSEDRTVIGCDFPSLTTGLTLAAEWRNFDLSLFFQGSFNVDAYLNGEASYAFFNSGKVLERHLDRWTPDNLDATYPRITNSDQINFTTSSYWVQDVSYLRLKNLMFGYTLPKKTVEKIGLDNVRVYFSGENLFTLCGLEDWDPEISSTSRGFIYSNLTKYSFGLKVSF